MLVPLRDAVLAPAAFVGEVFSVRDLLPAQRPALLLAPMQDVTDLPFMRIMARYGGPDIFVTEYFRVTPDSKPDRDILRSITENDTGLPVIAQMIGQDVQALKRTAGELEKFPVAGVDLNLGCPAPIVCRKDAGGGLLRYPERIDAILGALREAVQGRLTVKCRIGFESRDEFPALLKVFGSHAIDGLTVHGRTVRDGYRTEVYPECVALAVATLTCPVIANGNVVDVATGLKYLERTGAAGLMIGRGAIRHPWLFEQLRAVWTGGAPPQPTGRDLLGYINELWDATAAFQPEFHPLKHVQRMKKFMAFIAAGVHPDFEFRIRRVETPEAFFAACGEFLDHAEPVAATPPESSAVFCGFPALLSTG